MRAKKRQKVYTGADRSTDRKCEQSTEPEETAETVQPCKGTVTKRRNSGRKFTRADRKSRVRGKKRQKLCSGVKEKSDARQKTAKSLQRCEGKVGYTLKNDRNFTRMYRKSRLRAKKRQKLYKSGQTERTESANRVRNRKKRQKVYARVKKRSDT